MTAGRNVRASRAHTRRLSFRPSFDRFLGACAAPRCGVCARRFKTATARREGKSKKAKEKMKDSVAFILALKTKSTLSFVNLFCLFTFAFLLPRSGLPFYF
jgi:hypothetical protein